LHPAEQKRRLAETIVALYHGPESGNAARARFDQVHRDRETPEDVEEFELPADWTRGEGGLYWLPRVLWGLGLATSKGEARRLIEQGGVRLDGAPVTDPDAELPRDQLAGRVLQVGRRRFVRLV
jgi:tyrosyl-tRNA synthetase